MEKETIFILVSGLYMMRDTDTCVAIILKLSSDRDEIGQSSCSKHGKRWPCIRLVVSGIKSGGSFPLVDTLLFVPETANNA